MSSFSLDGQRLAYTVHGDGPRLTVLLHGLLFNQRMHEALARGAGGARAPRGHARPARPRRLRPPAREVALLDAGVRQPGDRAARPARRAGGGRARDVARRQRGARGRRGRAGARARDGDRDAGARPRADRLRDRVHADHDRADRGRAGDAAAGPRPRGRSRAAGCRGRRTSCSTGSARTPSRAPPSSRACSSAAPRRRARSAGQIDTPTLVIGHQYDIIHPFSDAGMLAEELPNGRLLQANSLRRAAGRAAAADRRDRDVHRRLLEAAARAARARAS